MTAKMSRVVPSKVDDVPWIYSPSEVNEVVYAEGDDTGEDTKPNENVIKPEIQSPPNSENSNVASNDSEGWPVNQPISDSGTERGIDSWPSDSQTDDSKRRDVEERLESLQLRDAIPGDPSSDDSRPDGSRPDDSRSDVSKSGDSKAEFSKSNDSRSEVSWPDDSRSEVPGSKFSIPDDSKSELASKQDDSRLEFSWSEDPKSHVSGTDDSLVENSSSDTSNCLKPDNSRTNDPKSHNGGSDISFDLRPDAPKSAVTRSVYTESPESAEEQEEETYVGKWMLFFDQSETDGEGHTEHDLAWFKIDSLCREGQLWHAKASTALRDPLAHTPNLGCICCYTQDYRKEEEVRQAADCIRSALAEELCTKPIYYKTDSATLAKKYRVLGSGRVSIYRHKPDYSFWKSSADNTSWDIIRKKGRNFRPNNNRSSFPGSSSGWGKWNTCPGPQA